MIRFDKTEITFDSNLLTLGKPILQQNKYSKIDIRYDQKPIQIRFPKAETSGIFYNKKFNNNTLRYPKLDRDDKEIVSFNNWITDLENCIRKKLTKHTKTKKTKSIKDSSEDEDEFVTPIFRNDSIFIKFTSKSKNQVLSQKCFDFKGKELDINDMHQHGSFVPICNIPHIYIVDNKAYIQIYGEYLFASLSEKLDIPDISDILGDDLEESDENDSDIE